MGKEGRVLTLQGAELLQAHPAISQHRGRITKKIVDRIRSNEYIDSAELPPARGKSRQHPQVLDGQVIVMQAARPAAVRESGPGPGNMESVLCTLCGTSPSGKAARADGLPVPHCQGQHEIQVVIMGGL